MKISDILSQKNSSVSVFLMKNPLFIYFSHNFLTLMGNGNQLLIEELNLNN